MKLIKLEILNLASLDNKDGEVINFEEGALGETSIFSIVGPTGSGKSTLLDAICLALYNRAPRYPRKKGDRNQTIEIYGQADSDEKNRIAPTDGRNILTQGKKDGYSKLTFLANNGNVYRAEWHVHINIKKFTEPITNLFLISTKDGQPVEEMREWSELPSIIGLDYEQFLRTVLIAQGSFANFLTAKENERYELLEKLIGCEETYTRIAAEIKARKDAADDIYNNINASVNAFRQNVLEASDLEALNEEIARLEALEKQRNEQVKKVEEDLKWFTDNNAFLGQVEKLIGEEKEAQEGLGSIKTAVERLSLHDAILPAVDIQREAVRLEKAVADADKAIKDLTQDIEKREKGINEQDEARKHLVDKVAGVKAEIDRLTPHIAKAREIRALLEPARQDVQDKIKAYGTAQKEKNDAQKAVDENLKNISAGEEQRNKALTALENLTAEISVKKTKLAQAEENALALLEAEKKKIEGVNADKLQADKDLAATNYAHLAEAIEVVERIGDISNELASKRSRQDVLNKENNELKDRLKHLDVDSMKKDVEDLMRVYTLTTSEQWAKHRQQLRDEQPCPLCGSKHHPYVASAEQCEEAASALKTMLDNKNDQLTRMQQEEKECSGKLHQNDGELTALADAIGKATTELAAMDNKWNVLAASHSEWIKDKASLQSLKPACESAKEESEAALAQFNQASRNIETLQGRRDSATRDKNLYESTASTLMEKARGAVTSAETALAGFNALKPKLDEVLAGKTNVFNQANDAHEDASEHVKKLVVSFEAELGGKSPESEERRLQDDKAAADNAVDAKVEEITQLKTRLGELQGNLAAKQHKQQEDAAAREEKVKELNEWIGKYNSSSNARLSVEDVNAMLTDTCDWEAVRASKKDKEQKLNSATTLRKQAEEVLAKHQEKKPSKTIDELEVEHVKLCDDSQHQQLVTAKAKLTNHDNAVSQMGAKADELSRAEQDKSDWTEITKAIGGDGKTLRKIAQCYTLRFLIEHANDEIRKFNNRYELQQVKNSLGIRVIDHDRADDVRDTTSLSGGETFIVSLGLALGLSSLSSRNISFENLFIDEGFGTLDPDTLATVIDSLAMLQTSQGKKVGVISHTDTMSERITTQIRIIKNGNSGSSHIEVYPM